MSVDKEAWDERTLDPADDQGLQIDLRTLTPAALRSKYKREAGSHRNMLRRVQQTGKTMDPAWRDFRRFLSDMGRKPTPEHSLDRIDNTRLHYGPGAIRWADKKTQAENRSNVRMVQFDGEDITTAELARRLELPRSTVYAAIKRGVSPHDVAAKAEDQSYRPLRLTSDADLQAWQAAYSDWSRSIPKARRSDFPPEMFDVVVVSGKMKIAEDWLDARGFYQLSSEENEEANALRNSEKGQLALACREWLDHALKHLAHNNPALSERLTKRYRSHLDYWKWSDDLRKPSPANRSDF